MSWCNLHTILRLPTGIFYAQGVKTNVLFFTRSSEEAPSKDATRVVWVYDARSGAPSYGKTNPFKADDLADFARAFGNDPRAHPVETQIKKQGPRVFSGLLRYGVRAAMYAR